MSRRRKGGQGGGWRELLVLGGLLSRWRCPIGSDEAFTLLCLLASGEFCTRFIYRLCFRLLFFSFRGFVPPVRVYLFSLLLLCLHCAAAMSGGSQIVTRLVSLAVGTVLVLPKRPGCDIDTVAVVLLRPRRLCERGERINLHTGYICWCRHDYRTAGGENCTTHKSMRLLVGPLGPLPGGEIDEQVLLSSCDTTRH